MRSATFSSSAGILVALPQVKLGKEEFVEKAPRQEDPQQDDRPEQGHPRLEGAQREQALAIWYELKHSKPNAHAHLKAAPEAIRQAVLRALVDAMEEKYTPDDPFG